MRNRDVVAAITAVVLTHVAWNNSGDSLSGTIHLSFYVPRDSKNYHNMPAVLDVDGDGSPEALAVLTKSSAAKKEAQGKDPDPDWKVQVLDLKPARTISAPFRPKLLLESEAIEFEGQKDSKVRVPAEPLRMITGHVTMRPEKKEASQRKETASDTEDRTLKFFCGTDWHDAASKCATPCQSGQSTDCPEGERCYADTPCIHPSLKQQKGAATEQDHSKFYTTPAGGWPSVFTLWSNGAVTMHSLTAEQQEETDAGKKKKLFSYKGNKPDWQLQVKPMWQALPFHPDEEKRKLKDYYTIDWEDVSVTFVDALSADNYAGMFLVSATVTVEVVPKDKVPGDEEDDYYISTVALALDAATGKVLWKSAQKDNPWADDEEKEEVPLPVIARGTSSAARRRSMIPSLQQHDKSVYQLAGAANCLRDYRHSLFTSPALPFSYFDEFDSSIQALHFDHQRRGPSGDSGDAKAASQLARTPKVKKPTADRSRRGRRTKAGVERKGWYGSLLSFGGKRKKRKEQPRYGRPNVVVTHNLNGIQVRSLKNGRSLCHLSLQPETLYADINHDGTLDSLQVVTSRHSRMMEQGDDDAVRKQAEFIEKLVKRTTGVSEELTRKEIGSQKLAGNQICHILALSGLPTREELFSHQLCGNRRDMEKGRSSGSQQQHPSVGLYGAPPLVVEAASGKGYDVIAAVSMGFVSRFRGSTGRRQWQLAGKHYEDFPTWDDPSLVALARVESENVIPSTRPIVLAGENSVVLLSASSGELLSSEVTVFPQPSLRRPILVDFNADGTTDLLVATNDAVWGYQVIVRTGASVFFRVMIGLLLCGILLALLRNHFGPHPGKRSTDL